jgi:hypothetical protein
VRYKDWKICYAMSQPGAEGWILPLVPFHFTLVDNVKRDPFEQAVGLSQKTALSIGGALDSPSTAFQYDWNPPAARPAALAQVVRDAQGVPADAGAGELQPLSHLH